VQPCNCALRSLAVSLTRPGGEQLVQRCAQRRGYRCYLPQTWERKARRVRPVFPRYLFVWIDQVWWSLRSTPRVSRVIVRCDGAPAEIDEGHISRLRAMERNGLVMRASASPCSSPGFTIVMSTALKGAFDALTARIDAINE
jgi:transcription antitermination factor NusG